MAHHINARDGMMVITGGFHTIALPTTAREPKPIKLANKDDATRTLIRYSNEQLDRLGGYGAGMPAPDFYHQLWRGSATDEIIVDAARMLCGKGGDPSPPR